MDVPNADPGQAISAARVWPFRTGVNKAVNKAVCEFRHLEGLIAAGATNSAGETKVCHQMEAGSVEEQAVESAGVAECASEDLTAAISKSWGPPDAKYLDGAGIEQWVFPAVDKSNVGTNVCPVVGLYNNLQFWSPPGGIAIASYAHSSGTLGTSEQGHPYCASESPPKWGEAGVPSQHRYARPATTSADCAPDAMWGCR